jgi:hypothetical protein
MSKYLLRQQAQLQESFAVTLNNPSAQSLDLPATVYDAVRSERMTMLWWSGLCAVSLLNVGMWLIVAHLELPDTQYRFWQLVLSGIYVAVCAFRSAFPRIDLERLCLWDTPFSAVFVGRFVATLAEMCFAVQCALLLSKLSEMTGVGYLETLSAFIVPIIMLAQILCWYAVLTLNHLGHAAEEILWTFVVALLAAGLAGCWFHAEGALRIVIAIGLLCCGGAALVMSFIDVPMYISRWQRHRRAQRRYLPIIGGLQDTLTRRHSTRDWLVWRREVPWITLYFTVGVWLSIGMALLESTVP